MGPSSTKEVLQAVAALGPSVADDFYVATFREGKVQKVINMTGGPPRRVRRVLDFDSKIEIEKEEALALKRQELQLESRLKYEILIGKKERTRADVLLEMKKRKNAGALATVHRKKLIPAKKVSSVKKAVPGKNVSLVKDVFSFDELVSTEEAAPMDGENHTDILVSLMGTIPVEKVLPVEASPPRKKWKRRRTSLLHTSSKLLDPPSDPQGDDETLAEFLKKSVSTTGRASSDNVGIKVFQRRKVKFKAVRRRTSMIGDKQSSSILLCDDLCECEVCKRLSLVAPNSVECPTTGSRVSTAVSVLTSCSTNTVSDDVLEDGSLERLSTNEADQLSRPDSCMGDFDSLTLPDNIHHLPVLHCNLPTDDTDDIQELAEQFRVQVAQKAPASSEVASLGSVPLVSNCPKNSHVGKYDEYLESPSDDPECCDSDMPKLLDANSRSQLHEETFGIGDVGRGPCAFNTESFNFSIASPSNLNGNMYPVAENAASVVTPMELDLAVERIESILETLVTPDDLLPTHLSASISSASTSSRKKKRRRSFGELLSSDVVIKEGNSLREVSVDNLRIPQRQEGDLAEPTSVDAPSFVSETVLNSASNITEKVAFFATSESSVILGELISGQISERISERISELMSQELGPAPESTLSSLSEAKEPSAACSMDVEVVLPSSRGIIVVYAEESNLNGSDYLVPLSDAVEVVGTPIKPTSCDDGSDICLTPSIGSDAAKRDEGVGCASISKTLFSNLQTNGFSKRNRKSFSPKSQKAFLKACKEERLIPTSKIKLMKSNLSDRSFSMLPSEKTVQDPTPDESSGQDMLQCDVEQVQLLASSDSLPLSPILQTSDDTPNMSAPSPSGLSSGCHIHIVPGSPEYKKESYVSCQSVTDPVSICTPDNTVSNLPCTEGSLHINVECDFETRIDPNTPNEPVSQQPKSILKTRSDTCRGICDCPRCVSTCDLSTTARNFIRSQMRLADLVAGKLLDEMRNMRTLLEDASPSLAEGEAATSASNIPSEKAKVALESATKTDDWAKKEILKMSRDSKRVCRLIEVGPRRTIFADDAGHRLCHIRHLPAKKNFSKESLKPDDVKDLKLHTKYAVAVV